jgi:Raf kinase inhibitor-like YbhB/YbcL family protein
VLRPHAGRSWQAAGMTGNDPFATHPPVPSFTVTSTTLNDGDTLGLDQMSGIFGVPGGKDVSPQLSWSGAPASTQGYAVTVYDPDAPTGCGFFHWAVATLPADCTELPENAGDEGGPGLPTGTIQYRNDAGGARFLGAAPPPGHPAHRYFINVYALDTDDLGVPADATNAIVGFNLFQHTIARAQMIVMAGT